MVMAILPPLKLRLQDFVHRHSIKMLTASLSSGSALGASRSLALRLRRCNYWKVSLAPPSIGSTLGLHPVPYRENRRERPGVLPKWKGWANQKTAPRSLVHQSEHDSFLYIQTWAENISKAVAVGWSWRVHSRVWTPFTRFWQVGWSGLAGMTFCQHSGCDRPGISPTHFIVVGFQQSNKTQGKQK